MLCVKAASDPQEAVDHRLSTTALKYVKKHIIIVKFLKCNMIIVLKI